MARQNVDHYMPFFGRDFYASTAMWTAEEVGHYIRLLVIQWDSGGLPADLNRLEMVSPGITAVWDLLQTKFPAGEDGLRRNERMEEHRAKAQELKDARSEAGKRGNDRRWNQEEIANGSQTDRKPIAKGIANSIAKTSPPSPSPSPSQSLSKTPSPKDLHTHTHAAYGDEFRQPGWAADEWVAFAAKWNRTERAATWDALMAPNAWVDFAASPGWMQRAEAALARLPGCQWFQTPLAVTRFFEYVDRILAGEFDNPKQNESKPSRQRPVGNL